MGRFVGYRCSLCNTEYSPEEVTYNCPKDHGNLDVVMDFDDIRKKLGPAGLPVVGENSLWKYLPIIPVQDPGFYGTPFRLAGGTPVLSPPLLAGELNLKQLWVKDDSRNPTASFKDRASAVVIARAREIGAEVVVTASTGNAGAALAGMAAAVSQKSVILAPRTAPPAKIAQLLVFGSRVFLVDGSYDDAFDLTIQAADKFGWYCRNTGYNPFTAEGKKTAGFEIWDWHRLTAQKFPLENLQLIISVGDGNIISGIHKGFKDLVELGWIQAPPKIFGIQAEGSAAIANAYFNNNEEIVPVHSQTIADSIAVDLPRDGVRAVRAATQTGGRYLTVTDDEILQAIATMGKAGIFAEPAGATAYAGLVKAIRDGFINTSDPIMVLNTGSGLKDVKAAMQAVEQAPVIEPDMAALEKIVSGK